MKLEELSKKDNATKEEILNYFEIKSPKEALVYIENKIFQSTEEDIDNAVLYQGLERVLETSVNTDHNPISERLALINIFLQGYYNIDMRETSLFIDLLGAYNYLRRVESILQEKEEFIYYEKLYNKLVERRSDIGLTVNEFLGKLEEKVDSLDISEDKIDQLAEEARQNIEKIKNI